MNDFGFLPDGSFELGADVATVVPRRAMGELAERTERSSCGCGGCAAQEMDGGFGFRDESQLWIQADVFVHTARAGDCGCGGMCADGACACLACRSASEEDGGIVTFLGSGQNAVAVQLSPGQRPSQSNPIRIGIRGGFVMSFWVDDHTVMAVVTRGRTITAVGRLLIRGGVETVSGHVAGYGFVATTSTAIMLGKGDARTVAGRLAAYWAFVERAARVSPSDAAGCDGVFDFAETRCVSACCANHDACYHRYDCFWTSWTATFLTKSRRAPMCDMCNRVMANCIEACMSGNPNWLPRNACDPRQTAHRSSREPRRRILDIWPRSRSWIAVCAGY